MELSYPIYKLKTQNRRTLQNKGDTQGQKQVQSEKRLHWKNMYVKCVEQRLGGEGWRVNDNTRSIARQRVQTLFSLAEETLNGDPVLAQRYVNIARRIAMAAKIRLPTQYRRQICRHCKSFILPGVNCRVRVKQLREPHVVITCLNCGKQMRIPLSKKGRREQ